MKHEMNLESYLKEVSERESDATYGPWMHNDMWVIAMDDDETRIACTDINHLSNGEFIAHARSDIPKLLRIIEVLRSGLNKVGEQEHREGRIGGITSYIASTTLTEADQIARGEK